MQPGLASNLQVSCLSLPGAKITGRHALAPHLPLTKKKSWPNFYTLSSPKWKVNCEMSGRHDNAWFKSTFISAPFWHSFANFFKYLTCRYGPSSVFFYVVPFTRANQIDMYLPGYCSPFLPTSSISLWHGSIRSGSNLQVVSSRHVPELLSRLMWWFE